MLRGLRADTLTGALALAIALFIIFEGVDLEIGETSNPGSGFILFWTGLIMAGLAGLVLIHSLLPGADRAGFGAAFDDIRWGRVLYVVALLIVYTAVLPTLGFIIATTILLIVLFKTVEPQSWTVALLGSVLTTLSAWLVFVRWLGTQLPSGIFEIG
jgi:putative tricarboxylic transport membrane protein